MRDIQSGSLKKAGVCTTLVGKAKLGFFFKKKEAAQSLALDLNSGDNKFRRK